MTSAPRPRLSRQVQCRFTDGQFELLQAVANEVDRPLSAIVRDVVTVWALQHQAPVDSDAPRWDVGSMVRELEDLGDEL